MPPHIRQVGLADSPGLAAAHARAFDPATNAAPWSEADIRSLLSLPDVFGFGAVDGSGFGLGRAAAGEAELLTLAVDPSRRRHGLGRRLLEAVIVGAAARGAEVVHLEVAVDNRAAVGLYEAAGFAKAGSRRGYYARSGGRADALIMTLNLPGRS